LQCFEGSLDRCDTMLGEPFGPGSAHVMALRPIRVTGSRDELAAPFLDINNASAKQQVGRELGVRYVLEPNRRLF
jgi:hypothetical protein